MGSASGYIIESVGLPTSIQQSNSPIESFTLLRAGNKLSTLEGFTGDIHKNKFEFIPFSDLFPSIQIQSILCASVVATIDKCVLSNIRGKRDYITSPTSSTGNTLTFLGKSESIKYNLRL
jgi:hypothetical protein